MRYRFRYTLFVVGIMSIGLTATTADAQLGILTSAIGSGQLTHQDGTSSEWLVGEAIEEGDQLFTDSDSYAMIFFVSGLGGTEIEFGGTIVVEIDQNSTVEIRRGSGRRAPIDIHLTKGRVRAFFDAREHKDFILLSTPLGRLQVTGSVVYATCDLPDTPGSVFGTFDSQCRVTLADGNVREISQFQKVVVQPDGTASTRGITAAEVKSWEALPDLNLASAVAYRGQVRMAYADRTWVGEYVTGGERLEDVASERQSNIPSQEPEVVTSTPTVVSRTTVTTPQTQTRLRASSSGRTVGEENGGIGRDTLSRRMRKK